MFQNMDEALMQFVNGLSVVVFFCIVGYHYITVRCFCCVVGRQGVVGGRVVGRQRVVVLRWWRA